MKINTLLEEIYSNPESYDFRNALNEHVRTIDYDPYYKRDDFVKEISNSFFRRRMSNKF